MTEPGWMIVSGDFSQVELRLLAEFSADPALREAFASGADVHRATAASVLGIPLEAVTPTQRSRFKTVNYGLGAQGLSQQLGISRREAAAIIDAYFARFSGIKSYFDGVLEACRRDGFVEDIGGRWLQDMFASNAGIRAAAARAAINMPIHGSAAHAMKIALLRVAARLERRPLTSSRNAATSASNTAITAVCAFVRSRISAHPLPNARDHNLGSQHATNRRVNTEVRG